MRAAARHLRFVSTAPSARSRIGTDGPERERKPRESGAWRFAGVFAKKARGVWPRAPRIGDRVGRSLTERAPTPSRSGNDGPQWGRNRHESAAPRFVCFCVEKARAECAARSADRRHGWRRVADLPPTRSRSGNIAPNGARNRHESALSRFAGTSQEKARADFPHIESSGAMVDASLRADAAPQARRRRKLTKRAITTPAAAIAAMTR
jgi:hypothetical protein